MLGRPLGSSHPLSNNSHAVPRLLKGHSDWVTFGCGAAFALMGCTADARTAKRSARLSGAELGFRFGPSTPRAGSEESSRWMERTKGVGNDSHF